MSSSWPPSPETSAPPFNGCAPRYHSTPSPPKGSDLFSKVGVADVYLRGVKCYTP